MPVRPRRMRGVLMVLSLIFVIAAMVGALAVIAAAWIVRPTRGRYRAGDL